MMSVANLCMGQRQNTFFPLDPSNPGTLLPQLIGRRTIEIKLKTAAGDDSSKFDVERSMFDVHSVLLALTLNLTLNLLFANPA